MNKQSRLTTNALLILGLTRRATQGIISLYYPFVYNLTVIYTLYTDNDYHTVYKLLI